MRMGSYASIGGDRTRRVVRAYGKAGLRVPKAALSSAGFTPDLADLKQVQGYLAREIKRLQRRHAQITRAIVLKSRRG